MPKKDSSSGCLGVAGIFLVICAVSVGIGHYYGAAIGWVAFFAISGAWCLLAVGGSDGRD